MSETTSIEWCDATLNLWWGCTKVSDGCKFCYAEHLSDTRLGKAAWGPKGNRREVKGWRSTLNKIAKMAKSERRRRLRVFCQSMSDTFEGPETMGGVDSENWALVQKLRGQLAAAIDLHPELDFLILTKRPENVIREGFMPDGWAKTMPSNVWLGTSVEDQKTADERIPHLCTIPAACRFLSCEPLLGTLDLSAWMIDPFSPYCPNCARTVHKEDVNAQGKHYCGHETCVEPAHVHWVICGGESGPSARPMHPDWARDLRDQCQAAGVPFLFKQWGEWRPTGARPNMRSIHSRPKQEIFTPEGRLWSGPSNSQSLPKGSVLMERPGKKDAGRILDGRAWDEFPEDRR